MTLLPDVTALRWSPVAAAGRVRPIAHAELLLLVRNRAALVNAVLAPVAIVGLAATTHPAADGGLSANVFLTTSLLGFIILSTVYYTLVSTYVARREGLVLKRLRVGELTDAEILIGAAIPAIVLALGQAALFGLAASAALDLPVPVNPPVLLFGLLGGVVVFALLAAASAVFTRTVEMAQVSTLPVLLAGLLGSGTMIPLDGLGRPIADLLSLLPLSPSMDLMRLGWSGTAGKAAPAGFLEVFGAAAGPGAILVAWMVVGVLIVRQWFRWEPRR